MLSGAAGKNDARNVRLVQGSHIVVNKVFEHDRSYIFQNADGRIIFAIPYEQDYTLIGTTDRDFEGDPKDVAITPEETAYLCEAASEYFAEPITEGDIVWTYSGVRPLYDDGAAAAQAATRDYVLREEGDPDTGVMVNIFGGKITTYRRLAESVLERIESALGARGPRWTGGPTLPGGDFPATAYTETLAALQKDYPFLSRNLADRLLNHYGTRSRAILGNATSLDGLGTCFGADLHAAEVDYLIDQEWATSADDILWRRSKLGLKIRGDAATALDTYVADRIGRDRRAANNREQDPNKKGIAPRGSEMPGYILAIDQGTTSTRSIGFDDKFSVRGIGQQEFEQYFPDSGWVVHEPEDLLRTTIDTVRLALADSGLSAGDIAAIGITNQRETTLVWDRATGTPIHRAIVWQDRRTADVCRALKEAGHEATATEKTGLLLDPYFSGTKIAWMLDNVPGARDAAERGELAFGTVDTWLIWNLTGGKRHVTDATNASRTLLYDIRRGAWDDEMLAMLRVPASMLPEVLDCAAEFGVTDASHFGAEIPILGVAGDQQAATVGQACFEPGMMKSTYGTGCFALLNTGEMPVASTNQLLTTIAYQLDGKTTYALEGAIFVAGAAIQWLRDGLGMLQRADASAPMAAAADPTQKVYLVPAFTGLVRPIGIPTRGARCSASPGARGRMSSRGRPWTRSASRPPI